MHWKLFPRPFRFHGKAIMIVFCCLFGGGMSLGGGMMLGSSLAQESSALREGPYFGLYIGSKGKTTALRYSSSEALTEDLGKQFAQGLRLIRTETYVEDGQRQFVGIYEKGATGGNYLWVADTWAKFTAKYLEFIKQGFRLVDFEPYKDGKTQYLMGVYRSGEGLEGIRYQHSWNDFVNFYTKMTNAGLRLLDFEYYQDGGRAYYVGVYGAGGGADFLSRLTTFAAFAEHFGKKYDEGLRLQDFEIYREGSAQYYVGVYREGKKGQGNILRKDPTWESFEQNLKQLASQGLMLANLKVVETASPTGGLSFTGSSVQVDPVTGISFPKDMPPIRWPIILKADKQDEKALRDAWAYAHYYTWRTYQFINYVDELKDKDKKKAIWKYGYDERKRSNNWSAAWWFGGFKDSKYRFQLIKKAIRKVWKERFLHNGMWILLSRHKDSGRGAHPCFTKDPRTGSKPSANHFLLGRINFCNGWFKEPNLWERRNTLIHEMFHHLTSQGLVIVDLKTHYDKKNGLCTPKTEPMYGAEKARHLAVSNGCWGNSDPHRRKAARNNDNYAYFIARFGNAVYKGDVTNIP